MVRGAFDGMTPDDVTRALVLSARSRIERDPAYDDLAAELQASIIYRQAIGQSQFAGQFEQVYREIESLKDNTKLNEELGDILPKG